MQYFEYRGVEGAVFAEVTADDSNNYSTGAVEELVGLSEENIYSKQKC